MDDYLREIQTAIFRKWISNQKRDYYHLYPSETDPDAKMEKSPKAPPESRLRNPNISYCSAYCVMAAAFTPGTGMKEPKR